MKHERPYDTRVSAYRQSHYRAPRTLSECQFLQSGDPIDRPFDKPDRIVMKGCAFIAFCFVVLFFARRIPWPMI